MGTPLESACQRWCKTPDGYFSEQDTQTGIEKRSVNCHPATASRTYFNPTITAAKRTNINNPNMLR